MTLLLVLALTALAWAGWSQHRATERRSAMRGAEASTRAGSPERADVSVVRTALRGLRVVPRPSPDPTYGRADFGPAWKDTDRNGCSQRRDVLAATVDRGRPVVERRRGRCMHDVIAGTWGDPYTGRLMTFSDLTDPRQAQQIPIDHIVALANAYRYGARTWTDEQRLTFATDVSNLQPTSPVDQRSQE